MVIHASIAGTSEPQKSVIAGLGNVTVGVVNQKFPRVVSFRRNRQIGVVVVFVIGIKILPHHHGETRKRAHTRLISGGEARAVFQTQRPVHKRSIGVAAFKRRAAAAIVTGKTVFIETEEPAHRIGNVKFGIRTAGNIFHRNCVGESIAHGSGSGIVIGHAFSHREQLGEIFIVGVFESLVDFADKSRGFLRTVHGEIKITVGC